MNGSVWWKTSLTSKFAGVIIGGSSGLQACPFAGKAYDQAISVHLIILGHGHFPGSGTGLESVTG